MPGAKQLSDQMRLFAERLAVHGVAMRAAEEASYRHPKSVGTRLERNPKIQAEVARLRQKLAEQRDPKVIADAEEIQSFLTGVMRGEVADYELTLSGDKEELPPKLETRRKAAMDLARLQGLVVNKNEHTGKDGAPIALEAYMEMSTAELTAKALELAKARGAK